MRESAGISPLLRAWITLIALSGASAVVAVLVSHGMFELAAGAVILALALAKSRIILSRYLGLWQAPSWRAGFNTVLTIYCLILLVLFLIPEFRG